MIEHWWDVPISGRTSYQASSKGNIRNKNTGRLLKPSLDKDGYERVSIAGRGGQAVSKIVALTFLGPCKPGMQTAHIDGNNRNNDISNLRYATPRENTHDKFSHGTMATGSRNGATRLDESSVSLIKARLRSGETAYSIAKSYGVDASTIRSIKFGKTWKEIE